MINRVSDLLGISEAIKRNLKQGNKLKVFLLATYLFASSAVLMGLPAWFLYRRISYHVTRERCIKFIKSDQQHRSIQMRAIAGKNAGITKVKAVCSYFKR